jgi:amidase
MYGQLAPILDSYNILVCPTVAVPAVKIGHDEASSDFRIDGQKVPARFGWAMTHPFSLMSHFHNHKRGEQQ